MIKRPYGQTWTYREKRVLELTARGYSQIEIGQKLGISHKTVSWFLCMALRKYGLSKETMAARYALEHGRNLENKTYTSQYENIVQSSSKNC